MAVGISSCLPVVTRISQREYTSSTDSGGKRRYEYIWKRLSKRDAIERLEKIISFGKNEGKILSLSNREADLGFFIPNDMPLFDGAIHTCSVLQGKEIVYEGKIYELPKLWVE